MASDKYFWDIGSPPPVIDKHSQIKHAIIKDYVEKYILTLMANAQIPELRLSIVDGFCGGGCYRNEGDGDLVDGSPILLMRAAHEARLKLNLGRKNQRNINVEYFFVDNMPSTIEYLKYWLNAKYEEKFISIEEKNKTYINNNCFVDELPSIIHRIKERKMGERSIFVLDQYSYKDVSIQKIANIFNNLKGAEVILTFNVDNLITFLSENGTNREALKRINLAKYIPWDELNAIKSLDKHQWRWSLQKWIADGIQKESRAKFMSPFFIKPYRENSWGYWLIHLSNSYRAHAVMKSIHWKYNTEFIHEFGPVYRLGYNANEDVLYTGQNTFDFADPKAKERCIYEVRENFGKIIFQNNRPMIINNLYRNTISNSTADESHLNESIRQLHSSKKIIITSKDGKIKQLNKKYSPSDIIEPSKQIILI